MWPGAGGACEYEWGRRGTDFLTSREFDRARAAFDHWQAREPDNPMPRFYQAIIPWVEAEPLTEADRERGARESERALKQLMADSEEAAARDRRHALTYGMAESFLSRIYIKQGHYIKGFRFARRGHRRLTELLQQHPDLIDANLVLGLYDVYIGAIPGAFRWLVRLLDLDGDTARGVERLELTVAQAPTAAPEAARILLQVVAVHSPRGCDYLPLSREMLARYGVNPDYSLVYQRLHLRCGLPREALAENHRARRRYQLPAADFGAALDDLSLQAHQDLGQVQALDVLRPRFSEQPARWTLARARALDVAGRRRQAVALYETLVEGDRTPRAVEQAAHRHLDTPYRPPPASPSDRRFTFSRPCAGKDRS